MRILLTHPLDYLFSWGGAHKCDRTLIRGLAALGHSCRLFAPAGSAHRADMTPMSDEEITGALVERGVEILSFDGGKVVARDQGVELHLVRRRQDLRDQLIAQCEEFSPTWLVISEDYDRELVREAVKHELRNVVYIAHSPATLPFGRDAAQIDEIQTQCLDHVAGIMAVSDYLTEYIHAELTQARATTVRFPVYGKGPFPRLASFDNPYVTIVNPSGIKGASIFSELARRMPETDFAAVVTWAASSTERTKLEAIPNVTLLQPEDDIERIFERTRVLLAPSLWGEAFGLVVVEAMLRGVPVLASDYGGLPEAKQGVDFNLPVRPITKYRPSPFGPTPILPKQNVDPWEEALRRVVTDRAFYKQLSRESRRASTAFFQGLRIETFVTYLSGLSPSPVLPRALKSKLAKRKAFAELSDAKKALLAKKLLQKKRRSKSSGNSVEPELRLIETVEY